MCNLAQTHTHTSIYLCCIVYFKQFVLQSRIKLAPSIETCRTIPTAPKIKRINRDSGVLEARQRAWLPVSEVYTEGKGKQWSNSQHINGLNGASGSGS